MKNIPLNFINDQLCSSNRGIRWDSVVMLSRISEGLHTFSREAMRYSTDSKETREKVSKYLVDRGYILHPRIGGVSGLLMRPDENYIHASVTMSIGAQEHNASLEVDGSEEETTAVINWFKAEFDKQGSIISTASRLDAHGHIEYDRTFILAGTAQVAKQSFYPWLSIPLEEYFQKFMESNEAVLVMFGPPGTGKSTFLRSLITYTNHNAVLAYNKQVVESPSLLSNFYRSSKYNILAYEDIDNHLAARENGNTLMSSMLNAADGVVRHKGKKLVYVTNLPSIKRIDSALLRAGRCFDIPEFKLLTPDQAERVRVDTGMPERDFDTKKEWSLAEVLNEQNSAQQTISRFAKPTGFI